MFFFYQKFADDCKILSNLCTNWSTRWVPNGYGYPPGMGTGKVLYPRVRIWVEFCTHWLHGYGYGIGLPAHTLPIAILSAADILARQAMIIFYK